MNELARCFAQQGVTREHLEVIRHDGCELKKIVDEKHSLHQMLRLSNAMRKAGLSWEDINKIIDYRDLACLKDLVEKRSHITKQHIIDLAAKTPEHCRGYNITQGPKDFVWDPEKVVLMSYDKFFCEPMRSNLDIIVQVRKMKEAGVVACNANLPYYLLYSNDLLPDEVIPKSWKGKKIFFPGTIEMEYLTWNYFPETEHHNEQMCWSMNYSDDSEKESVVAVFAS